MRFLIFLSKVMIIIITIFTIKLINDINSASEEYKDIIILKQKQDIVNIQQELFQKQSFYKDSLIHSNIIIDSLKTQLESVDYTRFKIWCISDIKIPEQFPYVLKIWNLAKERGIPIEILTRLIYQESKYSISARSSAGAIGYMQIMPPTYRQFNNYLIKGVNLPEKNIEIGINYLSFLYEFWKYKKPNYSEKEIWILVLASYNSGPRRVIDSGSRVPNIKETQNYVKFIMNLEDKDIPTKIKYTIKK
jgi:hypothetical protein